MQCHTRSKFLAAFMFAAAPLLLYAQSTPPQTAKYTVRDLGTFGGPGSVSFAYDMNNAGWVAGSGNTEPGGPQHAFLWFGSGPLQDLGTLGGPNSEAGGPNASGESALLAETAQSDPNGEDFCGFATFLQCVAAIWRGGKLSALPLLPGGQNSQAYGLNDRGQVIGFSETGIKDSSCAQAIPTQVLRYEAVIWEPDGKPRPLAPLVGDTVSFGFGINERGQAVGASGICSNTSLPPVGPNAPHAVMWEADGSVHDLGNLGADANNVATAINNSGEVVGNSQLVDGTIHPFTWTKTSGMHDLGSLPGAILTIAPCCDTINISGQVTGFAFDANFNMAAWVLQNGVITDMNTLLPADSPWYLLAAQALNDSGEITGFGLINGELHAFVATPIYGAGPAARGATKPKPIPAQLRKLLGPRPR